jgi:hypothetical protein
VRRALFLPLAAHWALIDELVSGSHFDLLSVSYPSTDDSSLVLVEFRSDDLFRNFKYRKGRMILDSQRHWALRDLAATMEGPRKDEYGDNEVTVSIHNEYGGDVDDYPFVKTSLLEGAHSHCARAQMLVFRG